MSTVDRSRLPDVGPDPAFSFPEIVRHVLPNGLEVRTIEHASIPVVTILLQVERGSGADAVGKEGLAAIVADMVDEGTGALSAIDVSDAMARIGADYDVDVSPDVTSFSMTTLTRFGQRGASLLADMTTKPSLRETDFTRVRQMRLDRLKQLKDSPPAVAERAFLRLVYAQHPYGHLPIGSDAALRGISLDDIEALHAAMFRPSRATLVINLSGSFILGWFLTYAGTRAGISETLRLAVAVGFLGAYTTFSTWMYESNQQFARGEGIAAAVNLLGSVVLGLIAIRLGIWMAGK